MQQKQYSSSVKFFSKYFFSFYLALPLFFFIPPHNDEVNFPIPKKSDDLLFYLQRTVNSNTVVYELNRQKNGEVNMNEPIKIYWIQYATDSTSEPLNYLQRNFAYGINAKIIDEKNRSFIFHFVSYKEKPLYLLKSAYDNKYHVYTYINNKLSVLDRVFVQIDGGTFWVPDIRYVEISGTIPPASEKTAEKIKP